MDSCGSRPERQQKITLVRPDGRSEGGSGLPVKSPPGRGPHVEGESGETRLTNFRQVSRYKGYTGWNGGALTSSMSFANGGICQWGEGWSNRETSDSNKIKNR